MNYIKGNFRSAIYESESGYKVGLFKVKETNDEELTDYVNKTITFTGYFTDLNTEDKYIFYGSLNNHERYGVQYVVKSYEKEVPTGENAVIEFLSSSLIKGCGEKTAISIVKTLGDEAISKIKTNYENLLLIPNMTEKKALRIYNSIMEYSKNDEVIIKLKSLGFTIKETTNIINVFHEQVIDILNNNIYEFKEIVPFNKLDNIFLSLNDNYSLVRIKACIIETMNKLVMNNGDTYHFDHEINNFLKTNFNLNVNEDTFSEATQELINEEFILKENDRYYLKEYYEMENNIANTLNVINNNKLEKFKDLDTSIMSIEKFMGLSFDTTQKSAIKKSINSNISIITGGPGTGKTTIVNAIVRTFIEINNYTNFDIMRNIVLLAPTGRASKRLAEITNLPAYTIHRFLKWNKEGNYFQINENNKTGETLIIVDEVSMLDTFILDALLKGLTTNIKLILIGDENQLPSVGGGLILSDLINSDLFTHIKLTKIFRQESDSYIPYLAKEIREQDLSNDYLIKKDDYNFILTSANQIKNVINQICLKGIEHNIDYKNMIVLAPMYRGENGIDNLNILLQKIFNPEAKSKKELHIADVIFREQDKVIQLVNDPDNNVFNGDIGYIDEVNIKSKEVLTVNFDGNYISYKREDLIRLKHAYAISVHKSQGSEFEHVIMPIVNSYTRMLYNKLIYTGVSRAKKSLIIIGEQEAFIKGVMNNYSLDRKTSLTERLLNKI